MGLDTLDNIRDSATNSGLGGSGLVSQAVQRNNIEDLRSLRSAISESQAARQGEDEQRKNQIAQDFLKNQQSIFASQRGSQGGQSSGVLDPNKPNLTISNNTQGNGEPDYTINLEGQAYSPRFQSLQQIMEYVQANGLQDKINVLLPGVGSLQGDELTRFQQQGGHVISHNLLSKLTPGNGSIGFPAYRAPEEEDTPHAKQMDNLKNKPSDFKIGQVEANTQAKIVSDVYSGLQRQASQGQNTTLYSQFKASLSTNNARGFAEALIKDGFTLNGQY